MYPKMVNGLNYRKLIASCKHEIWMIIKLLLNTVILLQQFINLLVNQ
ncbi:MAG: hypothetical protein BWY74_03482 [Firmicutes bacterium ADurb.Bin419]|nr:MAG: hypothetical protein BWY74_03482 [Firmicutes bacterium ADurb.Bin419]